MRHLVWNGWSWRAEGHQSTYGPNRQTQTGHFSALWGLFAPLGRYVWGRVQTPRSDLLAWGPFLRGLRMGGFSKVGGWIPPPAYGFT